MQNIIRAIVVVIGLFLPIVSFAQSGAQITSATFSNDYDTVSVVLSEAVQSAVLRYDLYINGNGYSFSSYSHDLENTMTDSMSGFKQQIMQQGSTGRATLEIYLCPKNYRSIHDCNAAFIVPIVSAPLGEFSDVPSTHSNADAIRYVHKRGLVGGYPDGRFAPDGKINRAEFTKIITLALFQQSMINQCETHYFSDVPKGSWYERYLCRARDGWLLTGYPDGTFKPGQYISFAEAAKIIANGYNLIPRNDHCNGKLCPDSNSSEHPWFEKYVQALEQKSAIPFSIFQVHQTISRGEMAEILYKLSPDAPKQSTQTYDALMRYESLMQHCAELKGLGFESCE